MVYLSLSLNTSNLKLMQSDGIVSLSTLRKLLLSNQIASIPICMRGKKAIAE